MTYAVIDARPFTVTPLTGVGKMVLAHLPWLVERMRANGEDPVFFISTARGLTLPDQVQDMVKTLGIQVVTISRSNRLLTVSSLLHIGPTFDTIVSRILGGVVSSWYVIDPGPWYVSKGVRLHVLWHDLSLQWYPSFFPLSWRIRWHIITRRSVIARVTDWHAVSEATAAQLSWAFPSLVTSVTVWPPLRTGDPFISSPVPVAGLVPGKFFLFLSTVSPRKNLAGILDAWRISHVPEDVKLAVVGDSGWLSKDVVARARVTSHCVVVGYVSDGEREWLLQNALAVLYPSFYEGFGMPPAEAAMRGVTPIVSTIAPLQASGAKWISVDPNDVASMREGIESAILDAGYWKESAR